jgi:hypothetical protein
MTKREDSKFFQVLVCQMRQDTKIDVIIGKASRVLPETELLKPVRNLLHRGPSPRGYRAELLDRAMERLTDKSQGSTPPLD